MADDRDKAIRDYTVLTPQVMHPRIVKPKVQAANFELKPVMFQICKQWGNLMGCLRKTLIFTLNKSWR